MAKYEDSEARPNVASVANVENPGEADTHDPFGRVGGGGGAVDLSEVDQDITLLNSHQLELQGDPEDSGARASLTFNGSFYGAVVQSPVATGESDLYVLNPGETEFSFEAGNHARLLAADGSAGVVLTANGNGQSIRNNGEGRLEMTGDMEYAGNKGPVLVAPDASLHRLKVANDGTLSTEPVV